MGLELGLGLREIGEIRFEIGVGESLAQLAYRVQLRVHGVEHVLGAPHDVTECNVPQLDSRVDEAEPQVRVAVGHLVRHDRAWLFGVQQCTHPAVAVVEILLPCAARIFVVPCLMPHRDARQAHRMESMLLGAQSVFDVIEFDERRHRQTDLFHTGGGDEAKPPSIEVHIEPAVQLGAVP